MKLIDQVCTVQQSVELFNFGIKESLYEHYYTKEGKYLGVDSKKLFPHEYITFPAFTVPELGLMLPDSYLYQGNLESLMFHWTDDAFGEGKRLHFSNILVHELQSGYDTEAECRADVLIWMLKNKIISPEKINENLMTQ